MNFVRVNFVRAVHFGLRTKFSFLCGHYSFLFNHFKNGGKISFSLRKNHELRKKIIFDCEQNAFYILFFIFREQNAVFHCEKNAFLNWIILEEKKNKSLLWILIVANKIHFCSGWNRLNGTLFVRANQIHFCCKRKSFWLYMKLARSGKNSISNFRNVLGIFDLRWNMNFIRCGH